MAFQGHGQTSLSPGYCGLLLAWGWVTSQITSQRVCEWKLRWKNREVKLVFDVVPVFY